MWIIPDKELTRCQIELLESQKSKLIGNVVSFLYGTQITWTDGCDWFADWVSPARWFFVTQVYMCLPQCDGYNIAFAVQILDGERTVFAIRHKVQVDVLADEEKKLLSPS